MVEDNITKILLNWNFYFLKPFLYVCFWYSEIIQSVLFCFAQARSSLPLRARHRASSPPSPFTGFAHKVEVVGPSSRFLVPFSIKKDALQRLFVLEREKGLGPSTPTLARSCSTN